VGVYILRGCFRFPGGNIPCGIDIIGVQHVSHLEINVGHQDKRTGMLGVTIDITEGVVRSGAFC